MLEELVEVALYMKSKSEKLEYDIMNSNDNHSCEFKKGSKDATDQMFLLVRSILEKHK